MSLSQIIKGLYLSKPGALGQRLLRPESIYDVGTDNLFTIAGGNILITALYAEVVVNIATAATGQVRINPTAAGPVVNFDDGLALYTAVPGSIFLLPMDVGFPVTNALAIAAPAWPYNYICPPGVIEFQVAAANINPGTLEWVLFYIPLDPEATVVISP